MLLAGEPGIGKSRVIRTLRERLGDEPDTPLSHYCSPYDTNSALYPVIDLLERPMRLDREAPPEKQLAKVEAPPGRSSDRPDDVVPLFAALLSLRPSTTTLSAAESFVGVGPQEPVRVIDFVR